MLHNKYKYLKSHGLLPKLQAKQSTNITTFAMLNKKPRKQYQLQSTDQPSPQFYLFNDKQYIHRKCSHIFEKGKTSQTINKLNKIYPKHHQTLTIFFVNDPVQADKMLFGNDNQDSMISMIYNEMVRKKLMKNKIVLSIFGVQNQNCLTDQLNYEWFDRKQKRNHKSTISQPAQIQRSKIKVTKNDKNGNFKAQNYVQQHIYSQQHISKILKKYRQMKRYYEEKISNIYQLEYYQLGQIYKLSQIQTTLIENNEKSSQNQKLIEKIVSTHYVLTINQYIRTTSVLTLKLSIALKKMMNQTKIIEMPDSKVFKILFQCFFNRNVADRFHIHLFLQVGQYQAFKEQYICLVPISEFLVPHKYHFTLWEDRPFFYTKQYSQYPTIIQKIKKFKYHQNHQYFRQQMQKSFLDSYKKIYNKSYFNPTLSSIEKKAKKMNNFSVQIDNYNSSIDQLVTETIKIYTEPSPALLSIKQEEASNDVSKVEKSKNLRVKVLERLGSKPLKEGETQFNKPKSNNHSIQFTQNIKQKVSKSLPKKVNKFYEDTKSWLGSVYGKKLQNNLFKPKKNADSLQLVDDKAQKNDQN